MANNTANNTTNNTTTTTQSTSTTTPKKIIITKQELINLFNYLNYDHKSVVINTFKGLTNCKNRFPTGSKPYDVSGVIKYHQKKKEYKDPEVCDLVNANNKKNDKILTDDEFHKIKQLNTQSSKKGTNYLNRIAEALDFPPEEYRKYLSAEGEAIVKKQLSKNSSGILSISSLYDLLNEKEQKALYLLIISLLNLQNTEE